MEEIGSKPLLLMLLPGRLALLDGVEGLRGRLSWGGMSWLGDTPPGNLPPEEGLAGTGNLGPPPPGPPPPPPLQDSGPGDGVGKVLALS